MKRYNVGDQVEFKGLTGTVISIVPNVNDATIQIIVKIKWDDGIVSSLACQQRGLNVQR